MRTFKITLIMVVSFFTLLFTLISSLLLTLQTTPNLLAFILRQTWHKEVLYEPAEYLEIKDDLEVVKDIKYQSSYQDNSFDIYYPKEISNALPTIIWIHGGGFISGVKEDISVFGALVASAGYTFISIDYELAPERHYPSPLIQTSEVIKHLNNNLDEFFMVDMNRLVIGGDSAGAHIAANFAILQTNQKLASDMNLEQVLSKEQLKGVLLYCGPYDLNEFDQIMSQRVLGQSNLLATVFNTFVKQIGWSYFGRSKWQEHELIEYTNIVENVTSDFPATFITDGNLVSFMQHGQTLDNKLQSLGVTTQVYFPSEIYDKDYVHEYQFDFEKYPDEALENLSLTLDFLATLFQ